MSAHGPKPTRARLSSATAEESPVVEGLAEVKAPPLVEEPEVEEEALFQTQERSTPVLRRTE